MRPVKRTLSPEAQLHLIAVAELFVAISATERATMVMLLLGSRQGMYIAVESELSTGFPKQRRGESTSPKNGCTESKPSNYWQGISEVFG
jgi:hypothetical protein